MFKNLLSSVALLLFAFSLSIQNGYAQSVKPSPHTSIQQSAPPQTIADAFQLLATKEVEARQNHEQIDTDELEDLYGYIWSVVGDQYPDATKLSDWGAWKHRYDGLLWSFDDLDDAVAAMLASLHDRWVSYASPAMIASVDLSSVDLGVWLQPTDNGLFSVVYVQGLSPAYHLLRKGDVIESVNGTSLKGLTQSKAEALLQGKVGTELNLIFDHDGKSDSAKVTLVKSATAESEARVLPGDILYLRLPEFSTEAVNKLRSQIDQAIAGQQGDITGMILDLRGNPGGLVDEGKRVASMFIGGGGIIMRMQERSQRVLEEQTFRALSYQPYQLVDATAQLLKRIDILQHRQMIVLIDGTSASCAEVVTAALQDNHRAVVVGETSWGKGVAWRQRYLPNGGSLRCTSGVITSPNGRSWAGIGLTPDVLVVYPRRTNVDVQLAGGIHELYKLAAAPGK